MFKHILVPVDGSNTSMLAVSKAAGLAQTCGSAVTAVYVVDPYPFTGVVATCAMAVRSFVGSQGRFLYSQGPITRLSFWPITRS